MQIEGRVAVVTGAGSGIGRALAESLAAVGARVVVGDIDAISALATAQRIGARGHDAVAHHADASALSDMRALIDLAATEFGPVDIYVANAGISGPPGIGADEDWDRAIDVNLRAHVRAAKVLLPGWFERGGGHFVSIASTAGLLTQVGAAAYAVTKHAAVGFAEWLAVTHGDRGIGVSCVCPLGVNTALLNTARESTDADDRMAAAAIINAGNVIEPELVADATVDAVREGRFLVLPHSQVLGMCRKKGLDYDRWITSMRCYQRALTAR
jgi:NAD(P)-dependent dehydrogenase (short-subunit alcohol dehydrogenase family)